MEWILEVATTSTGAEEAYDYTRLAWLGDAVARKETCCAALPLCLTQEILILRIVRMLSELVCC